MKKIFKVAVLGVFLSTQLVQADPGSGSSGNDTGGDNTVQFTAGGSNGRKGPVESGKDFHRTSVGSGSNGSH